MIGKILRRILSKESKHKTCPKCRERVMNFSAHKCLVEDKRRLDNIRIQGQFGNSYTVIYCDECGMTYDPKLTKCPHCN